MAIRSTHSLAAPTLAGADLSSNQYHGFKMNTSTEFDVSLIASQYDQPLGVLQNVPDADGEAADILTLTPGDIVPVEVGGSGVSAGDAVRFDNNGELATAEAGHPMAFGRVWKAWSDGEIAEVFVDRVPGDSGVVVRKFQYDFADLGGSQAALTLTDDEDVAMTIPDNANILRAYFEGLTGMTSGGSATVKLGITGDDDAFIAATAMDDAGFAAGALTELTAGTTVKTTAAVSVLATVATADLTAGKFNVWVEYTIGD